METYIITFRSVTSAHRGERILKKTGFLCTLGRAPRWMEEQGCGYALKVCGSGGQNPGLILRRENLPLRRVYRMDADGNLEEAAV